MDHCSIIDEEMWKFAITKGKSSVWNMDGH